MAVLKFKDPDTKEWKELEVVSDGVTFIPSIDKNGVLSWSNNGYLPNPDPIDLESAVLMFASKALFPDAGNNYSLYIDKSTNMMYRWDEVKAEYVNLTQHS